MVTYRALTDAERGSHNVCAAEYQWLLVKRHILDAGYRIICVIHARKDRLMERRLTQFR